MTQPPHTSLDAAHTTPGARSGQSHGSFQGYLAGYVASVLLTFGSFAVVQSSTLGPSSVTAAVTVLAIAQMLVHLIFFLHINTSPNQRTNILAFVVTMFFVIVIVAGSLWIMAHLESNMMPAGKLMQMQR
jgi:cytochrome o ubiquinol oxidase operon protein cyoD